MAYGSFTSKLEAVNQMLSTIGQARVASVPASGEANDAQKILEEVDRAIQAEGWHFNIFYDVDLEIARQVLDKSLWLDKELGALINSRFCALKIYYPKDGYIAWHNNWNVPGYNILFTYNETGEGHWRHINPKGSTGKINDISTEKNLVHIPDVKGWHVKTGYYGKKDEHEKVMWHSAWGGAPRMTLGYVVFDENLWKMMIEEITGKEVPWPLAEWDPSMLPEGGYVG